MELFNNFKSLFLSVWDRGILGVDILQILIGVGIFLIFLIFRGIISKLIIKRLENIAKRSTNKLDDSFVSAMEGPARFLPIVIGFFIASYYMTFSEENREIISNDLDKNLISMGYNIKRVINYTSKPNHQLDESFIEKLRSNMPDIVYVYSQNSALSFLKLINNYKLNDFWMNTNLMCISEKSSSVLNKIKWKKIFIFSPGEEEFLLYKI